MTHLKVYTAPEINSVDQNGEKITLDQYKGKKLVLFLSKRYDSRMYCAISNLTDNYEVLTKGRL